MSDYSAVCWALGECYLLKTVHLKQFTKVLELIFKFYQFIE